MSSKIKTIELCGMLDGIKGNELRRQITDILADGTDILLIDMKEVNFINSSGLGSLVSAMQVVRNANAKLFVCSVNDQVRMLFELTKMDRIFQTFVDQDDFNRQFFTAKQ
ncbi:STAS domain-containing protein [Anabaena sp. UHCC 0399]|uniref:STAS domain-containing protein n=1 Tax=Anabaena sp. UHCC 0399 TaxID=3110238 RepID=UPI002B1F59C5|nr:STAS domain-containing protein [Anabaena sp. UHCC 0399]MEA5568226.1 STAS domain-containing protein [Anabaena sp. UHCC 0399]